MASVAAAAAPDSVPAPPWAAPWSRRDWIALTAVTAAALTLRVLHLGEIAANDPFFANPSLDPKFYHDAAVALGGAATADDLTLIPSGTNSTYRGTGTLSDDKMSVTINGFLYQKN